MTPWNTWVLRLRKELAELDLPATELVVFVSGGSDSTALLRLLLEVTKSGEQTAKAISAVHVNYALRGRESDADQSFVEGLCRDLNVPLRVISPSRKARGNVQSWARGIRLLEIRRIRKAGNVAVLGHTADDLFETILMRIGRGCRSQNLVGMHRFRDGIWRPLLHLNKADILAEMASRRFNYSSDSSNAQDHYTRNKLRHSVVPALEGIYPGFGAKLIAHAHNHEQILRRSVTPGLLPHREATSQIVDTPNSKDASPARFQDGAPKRARTGQFLRAFQPPNALLLLDSRAAATVENHGRWHHIAAEERDEPVQNLWTVENVAACHKVPVRGYNELISVQRLGKVLLFNKFIRLLRQNGEVVAVVDSKGDAHAIPHRR